MLGVSCARVLGFGLLFAIVTVNFTSLNASRDNNINYLLGKSKGEAGPEYMKCSTITVCEAFCVQQDKLGNGPTADLDVKFQKNTVISRGWFETTVNIKKITFGDDANIVEIRPGAFDDYSFRTVAELEIKRTIITVLKKGTFDGLTNLKILAFHGNNQMTSIEEDTLDPLYKLEQFTMEDQKQLSILSNVTGTTQLKSLHTLILSKNSFRATISKPTFNGCSRVKILDLSYAEIESIGPESFEPMDQTIQLLNLSNNYLKRLPSLLLVNMIRPYVQLFLSNNIWECDCSSFELSQYDVNNSSLIIDSPLLCETPISQKGNPMVSIAFDECFSTTAPPQTVPQTTPSTIPTSQYTDADTSPYLENIKCFDNDQYSTNVLFFETEYQFFNINQGGTDRVSIEMNHPDINLDMILINDHDYEAKCQYNLKSKMIFDNLNPNAGHLFCLMRKFSTLTSPRNCLPFHFNISHEIWDRDQIVVGLACSFAIAVVLGVIIGWLLLCRYRRVVKSKDVPRRTIFGELNPSSDHQNKGKLFKTRSSKMRRSYSENSINSCRSYMTPSPPSEIMRIRASNPNEYHIRPYIEQYALDSLPPPLPPKRNSRDRERIEERIYETIKDPPFYTYR